MSKIKLGETYITHSYPEGYALARVIEVSGRIFKKYLCITWGVDKSGRHVWPNGSVRHYESYVDKSELTELWRRPK